MKDDRPRVLIVDDEPGIRDSLADLLELEGFAANVAGDGAEGLDRFRAQRYDAVLMDIRMPKMDGVEALRHIKRLEPQIPVIMITAFTQDRRVTEALQDGALDVFFKPLDLDRLFEILHRLRSSPKEPTVA